MKKLRAWIVIFMTAPYTALAIGADSDKSMLPFWCDQKARETSNWKSGLRGGIYHYCNGLSRLNAYWKKHSAYEKQYALKEAINEFNYMIVNNQGSKDPMLGEVYMNKAIALRLGGSDVAAISDLHKALEYNPGLPQVYIELTNLYIKLKQNERALEVVSQGLRHLPDTKALQKQYTSLGGKLPYPEAINKSSEEVQKQLPEFAPPQPPNPETKPRQSTEEKQPAPTQNDMQKSQEGEKKSWCRFCP